MKSKQHSGDSTNGNQPVKSGVSTPLLWARISGGKVSFGIENIPQDILTRDIQVSLDSDGIRLTADGVTILTEETVREFAASSPATATRRISPSELPVGSGHLEHGSGIVDESDPLKQKYEDLLDRVADAGMQAFAAHSQVQKDRLLAMQYLRSKHGGIKVTPINLRLLPAAIRQEIKDYLHVAFGNDPNAQQRISDVFAKRKK